MRLFNQLYKTAIFSLCFAVNFSQVHATENFPTRTIRLISPFPAGGTTDVEARVLASILSKELNEAKVIVENIPGAATVPAALSTLRDKPDGHSIILASDTTLNINKWTFKNPSYAVEDLTPITILHDFVHWISVSAKSEFKSFDEFKSYISQNPGKVSIAVNTHGGAAYLALDAWKRENNFDFQIITYKGGADATNALLGGHVDAQVNVVGSSSLPFARAGKIRPLAVLHEQPVAEFPNAVTQSKSNPKDFIIESYLAMAVNSKTPQSIINTIYSAFLRGKERQEFKDVMKNIDVTSLAHDPKRSKEYVNNQTARYEVFIKNSKLEKQ